MMALRLRIILPKFAFVILFLFLGFIFIVSNAMGKKNYTTTWGITYPDSETVVANCLICHSDDDTRLNTYGRDICLAEGADLPARLVAVESIDSDGDGTSNLMEIGANAQPGWTEGDNPLFYTETCLPAGENIPVPLDVPDPYDPIINCFIFLPFVVNCDG
jgi:hypothetical protein